MFFVTKALIEKSAHMKLARVARATPTEFFRTAGMCRCQHIQAPATYRCDSNIDL